MGILLVTVAWGRRRRDLAVRADVAIGDLLRPLAAALADGPPRSGPDDLGRDAAQALADAHGLALAPLCGEPLPADRSLEACRVVHGAVLALIDAHTGVQWPSRAG